MSAVSAFEFIPLELENDIKERTSNVDVTTFLQEWLDYCAENNQKAYLPAGLYKVSGPLWVTRTKWDDFYSANLEGDGGGYTNRLSQSTIETSDTENPALIIQRGRGVRIAGICISGQNVQPEQQAFPTNHEADWVTPGLRTNSTSPYCGIAIDPTLGSRVPPIDGRYPELVDEYAGDVGGSKNVVIENVAIRRFVVGVMVSPAYSNQAEMVVLDRCHIGSCQFGISYGQPQSRANVVSKCDIEFCQIGVTAREHGNRQGAIQTIENCQFVRCFRGLDLLSPFSAAQVNGCYFEVVQQMARFGAGYGQVKAPLSFNACEFRLDVDFGITGKYYEPYLIEADTNVSFRGCWFADNSLKSRVMNFVTSYKAGKYHFDGCSFWGFWSSNQVASIANQHSNGFVTVTPATFNNCLLSSNNDPEPLNIDFATAEFTFANIAIEGGNDGWSIEDDTLSFTAKDQQEADKAKLGGLIFWECLGRAIPAIEIDGIDGLNITGRLMFNPIYYGDNIFWSGQFIRVLRQPRGSAIDA